MTYELPRGGQQRLSVLGWLNRTNEAYFYPLPGWLGSTEIIVALAPVAAVRPHRLTLVILDNAPLHRGEAVIPCLERWLVNGVGIHFLPPDCPELKRSENLWRKIKDDWLPFSAYTRFAALQAALLDICRNIALKYQITFG